MTCRNPARRFLRLAILGPTCSGKSATALELARRLDGELISCDSMQVYRGMDVGTAKPTADEQRYVRHHLVDVLDISEPYNVNIFLELCRPVLDGLAHDGKNAVLAGGSGLYARSLLYGHQLLPSQKDVYAAIWSDIQSGQLDSLVAELARVSPACAESVRQNPRHVARAVEILRLTSMTPDNPRLQPPSAVRDSWLEIVILPPWDEHRRLIAMRTRKMLESGWIEETRRLMDAGLEKSPTARQALGYPEVAAYLRGEIPNLAELESRITTKTCQLAKRQRTWFRHQHPSAIQLPVFMFDADAGAKTCLEILRERGMA
jgi:tRNA dimethylallyltransferase